MSVLRQDPTTGGWVIVAPGRSSRPHQHAGAAPAVAQACPLCPGQEHQNPAELFRLPGETGAPWAVRVVPNKYPVLSPDADGRGRRAMKTTERRLEAGEKAGGDARGTLQRELQGVGHHELVIDTPHHDGRMVDMNSREIGDVLGAYHARYETLRHDPNVAYVIVFKNSGPRAGASLVHPHSQLVATPMAPLSLERRYVVARAHYAENGTCLYCDLRDLEAEAGVRVVHESERFVVICPFASGVPFETWILPTRHQPSFGATSTAERLELARLLGATLRALDATLGGPDFNFVIHTAPVADEDRPYYLWHLQILPRIATLAGFELGSGIPINTAFPEDAAATLRRAPDIARL